MFNHIKLLSALLFIIITGSNLLLYSEDTNSPKVGVDEKLGETIPLDLSFLDETGKPVNLRSLVNKPTLLTLVYYRCRHLLSAYERSFGGY